MRLVGYLKRKQFISIYFRKQLSRYNRHDLWTSILCIFIFWVSKDPSVHTANWK